MIVAQISVRRTNLIRCRVVAISSIILVYKISITEILQLDCVYIFVAVVISLYVLILNHFGSHIEQPQ